MTNTLRLIFPEWQGGWPPSIEECLDNKFNTADTMLGYRLGSRFVNLLVPPTNGPNDSTAEVPVTSEYDEKTLAIENHIFARQAIIKQASSALSILEDKNPSRIIVIGGECAVSLAPFKYIINKYGSDNVGMIWFDAHPDITIPEDIQDGRGFSEMPVSHIMGLKGCDPEIMKIFDGKGNLNPSKFTYVGLRWLQPVHELKIKELNLHNITVEDCRKNPEKIEDWIKQSKCSKFVVHLDLDVLEPSDLFCAACADPNGILVKEFVDAINRINNNAEIIAFTIAETMPKMEMRMKNMLKEVSLFK